MGDANGNFGRYAWSGSCDHKVRRALVVFITLACVGFIACLFVLRTPVAYAAAASDSPASSGSDAAVNPFKDSAKVDMSDGVYLVDVRLQGGSGKASVESPAELEVFDGAAVVQLVWSSEYYDYMIVKDAKYYPINESGNSTFAIPVLAFDEPFPVIGDTTAMGSAHEISYTLTVDLDSVVSRDVAEPGSDTEAQRRAEAARWPWVVFAVCAVLSAACTAATVFLLRKYHKQR